MAKLQTEAFVKVTAPSAGEICDRVELSSEARAFLLPDLSPQGYLALLVDHDLTSDAIRFMGFCLPVREAVWWAAMVAHYAVEAPDEAQCKCLACAVAWVYEPRDEFRRSCLAAAEGAHFDGPVAYAALAAYWSGGSLAPEGMPEAPADPRLAPTGVGASVLLSLTSGDPLAFERKFESIMARGIDIANGGIGLLEGEDPIPYGRESVTGLFPIDPAPALPQPQQGS